MTAFLFYLVNVGQRLSVALFWMALVLMVSLIALSITTAEMGLAGEKVILFAIFVLSLALHLVFVLPLFGLWGYDSHFHYEVTRILQEYRWPVPSEAPIQWEPWIFTRWIVMHIFTLMLSEVNGIELFALAKVVPAIWSSLSIFFLFLLVKEIYDNKRVALLASFGFSSFYHYISAHSTFFPESFAFPLMLAAMWSHLRALRKGGVWFPTFAILFASIVVLAHHFASFMLMSFLVLWFVSRLLFPHFSKIIGKKGLKTAVYPSIAFVTLVAATSFVYWIYIGVTPLDVLAETIKDLSQVKAISSVYAYGIETLRTKITYYGNWFFTASFGMIMLYELVRVRCSKKGEDFALFLWIGIMFLAHRLVVYVIESIQPGRIYNFAYVFMLAMVAHTIGKSKKLRIRVVMVTLIAAFVVFQVFMIPPHLYDHTIPPEYEQGMVRWYYLPQEYAAVAKVDYSGTILGDEHSMLLLQPLREVPVFTNPEIFEGDLTEVRRYNWLFFRKEMLQGAQMGRAGMSPLIQVSLETYHEFNNYPILNLVYDNGEVKVYKISP